MKFFWRAKTISQTQLVLRQAMAVRCFLIGYIVLAFVLISGNLPPACAKLPESGTAESASQKVYNICCSPQNCSENDYEMLETIANEVKEEEYSCVQININATKILLNSNISFSNLTSLTINGEINQTNISCEASANGSAGIVLSDVHLITLNNLTLMGCGSMIKDIFKTENNDFSSALTMIHCIDVQINRLNVAWSKGTGLTILNHQGGTVNIKLSSFEENTLPQGSYARNSTSPIFGGGGVYLCLDQLQGSSYSPMTFRFDSCTFANNVANNKYFPYLFSSKGYGEGGGVYLSIGHTNGISNVNVSFLNCNFSGNYALVGGGLSVKVYGRFGNKTTNISVIITDSRFRCNGCKRSEDRDSECAHFGGGAYFSLQKLSEIESCHYQLTRVNFSDNCAQYGGGVFYYSDRSNKHSISIENSVLFDDCVFNHNTAHIGSAVDMIPNMFRKLSSGYSIVPTFRNCEFWGNFVFIMTNREKIYEWNTPGHGTICTSHQDIYFQGHNSFKSNWGTALYVMSAVVNFQNSSASFVNNTGLQGGAIALVESATMIVGPHDYVFRDNRAYYQGGAIYVLLIGHFSIEVSRSCFIQYIDCSECNSDDVDSDFDSDNAMWKANITFTNNTVLRDTQGGSSIYSTSLYSCQVINKGTNHHPEYIIFDPCEALKRRGMELDCNGTDSHEIATDGAKFHFPTVLKIIPGKEYSHNITVRDDLSQKVSVPFRVDIRDPVEKHQLSNDITSNATFIEDIIQLMGHPNQTAILYLHTLSTRQIFIKINVTLVDCPPGFTLRTSYIIHQDTNTSKPKCVCNTNAPVGIFKCDSELFHSHLLPGYWAGFLYDVRNQSLRLVTSTCPFCNYSKLSTSEYDIDLPQTESELNETICGETRTGIVCGNCQDNYTVHFHSPDFKCKGKDPVGCKLGWLFYLLSEIVPVTVVFIIVLVFNISFTSGTISGFVLFSQLLVTLDIDAGGIIKFSYSVKHSLNEWAQGYQMLYGFFNLNFFNTESLSFCIMTNATALDMLAFKYVTILYTLLLILSVIWVMNKCGGRCCGKYCRITTIRSSVVHGISSFLVMCYTQCVQVSMNLLNPVHFNVELDIEFNPPARVWLNGDIVYFSKEHLNTLFQHYFVFLPLEYSLQPCY